MMGLQTEYIIKGNENHQEYNRGFIHTNQGNLYTKIDYQDGDI
jgi:hypothetical protein